MNVFFWIFIVCVIFLAVLVGSAVSCAWFRPAWYVCRFIADHEHVIPALVLTFLASGALCVMLEPRDGHRH